MASFDLERFELLQDEYSGLVVLFETFTEHLRRHPEDCAWSFEAEGQGMQVLRPPGVEGTWADDYFDVSTLQHPESPFKIMVLSLYGSLELL